MVRLDLRETRDLPVKRVLWEMLDWMVDRETEV